MALTSVRVGVETDSGVRWRLEAVGWVRGVERAVVAEHVLVAVVGRGSVEERRQ